MDAQRPIDWDHNALGLVPVSALEQGLLEPLGAPPLLRLTFAEVHNQAFVEGRV